MRNKHYGVRMTAFVCAMIGAAIAAPAALAQEILPSTGQRSSLPLVIILVIAGIGILAAIVFSVVNAAKHKDDDQKNEELPMPSDTHQSTTSKEEICHTNDSDPSDHPQN